MLPAGRPPGLLRELLRDLAQAVRLSLHPPRLSCRRSTRIAADLEAFLQTAQRRPLPPLRTFSSTQAAPLHPLRSLSPRFPSPPSAALAPAALVTTPRARTLFGKSLFKADRLRDAVRDADSAEERAAAQVALAQHLFASDGRPDLVREGLEVYEDAAQLWAASGARTEVLADDEAFRGYLRSLALIASSPQESDEVVAQSFDKIQQAASRRAEFLKATAAAPAAPSAASDAPAPASAPSNAPASATNSATPQVAAAATTATATPSIAPSTLISALFSGGAGRGKGGEAKIQSLGSFANWGSGAAGTKSAGPEPIRVVVEEAKTPLVWRLLKFVAVTALYSFLLCVSAGPASPVSEHKR